MKGLFSLQSLFLYIYLVFLISLYISSTNAYSDPSFSSQHETSPILSSMPYTPPEVHQVIQRRSSSASSGNQTSSTGSGTSSSHSDDSDKRLLLFVFGGLCIGAITRQFMAHLALPYTVIVLLEGCVIGAISRHVQEVADYTKMSGMDGHLLLLIFLPALIFESAFALDLHIFKNVVKQCLILAMPALLMATFLTAVCAKFFLDYDWSWIESFLFGAIASATDPVAVVALLADLGASKKLGTMIEGESLLNDGTAIVIFAVFFDGVEKGHLQDTGSIVGVFFRMAIGGPAIGASLGFITVLWLGHVFNDALVEITITLCSTYLVYWVSEIWAGSSGVLAVVALGITLNNYRTRISPEVEHFLHRFWHTIAYLANTLIFFLVGVEITENAVGGIDSSDWWKLLVIYVCIIIVRAIVLSMFWPAMSRVGYKFSWQEGMIAWWGGLRGAVGLALAVVVVNSQQVDSIRYGDKVLFLTSGIVFLTLLVNATTIKPLLNVLGLNEVTFAKKLTIANAVKRIRAEQELTIRALKNDRFLSDADWNLVNENVEISHPYEEVLEEYTKQKSKLRHVFTSIKRKVSRQQGLSRVAPTLEKASSNDSLRKDVNNPLAKSVMELATMQRTSMAGGGIGGPVPSEEVEMLDIKEEARMRYLKTQKTSFWRQFEDGVLGKDSVLMLNAEIDKAMDIPHRLIEVEDIVSYCQIPRIWLKMKTWPLLHRFAKAQINDRLTLAYDMGMGFMVSVEEANTLIVHTTSDQSIADELIELSESTRKQVLLGMAELKKKYPEIAMAVKTKQAIRSVLNQGNAILKSLQESGIMEDSDIGYLMMVGLFVHFCMCQWVTYLSFLFALLGHGEKSKRNSKFAVHCHTALSRRALISNSLAQSFAG